MNELRMEPIGSKGDLLSEMEMLKIYGGDDNDPYNGNCSSNGSCRGNGDCISNGTCNTNSICTSDATCNTNSRCGQNANCSNFSKCQFGSEITGGGGGNKKELNKNEELPTP